MDKFIKEVEEIISDNLSYGIFEDLSRCQAIALSLSRSLNRYRERLRRSARFSSKEISSGQRHEIDILVDCARYRMTSVLGIDDKRVKE